MSTDKKSTFSYAPPDAAIPEQWLAAILGSKRTPTERNVSFALAWSADRHGNPVAAGTASALLWKSMGLDQSKTFDQQRLVQALNNLKRDGWLHIALSDPQHDNRRAHLAYRLTLPTLEGRA